MSRDVHFRPLCGGDKASEKDVGGLGGRTNEKASKAAGGNVSAKSPEVADKSKEKVKQERKKQTTRDGHRRITFEDEESQGRIKVIGDLRLQSMGGPFYKQKTTYPKHSELVMKNVNI